MFDLHDKKVLRTFGQSGSNLWSYCTWCLGEYTATYINFLFNLSQYILPNVKSQYCRIQAWEHVHHSGSSKVVLQQSLGMYALVDTSGKNLRKDKIVFWSGRQLTLKQKKFWFRELMCGLLRMQKSWSNFKSIRVKSRELINSRYMYFINDTDLVDYRNF